VTLIASVAYGLYQVLYKKYAALPFDPEFEPAHSRRHSAYESIGSEIDVEDLGGGGDAASLRVDDSLAYPPPFGLFPNLLTTLVGLCTFTVLWIFLPALHAFEIEKFRLPEDAATISGIVGVALGGMVFNAGFMVSTSCFSLSSFAVG
jgi:hypothetical protein